MDRRSAVRRRRLADDTCRTRDGQPYDAPACSSSRRNGRTLSRRPVALTHVDQGCALACAYERTGDRGLVMGEWPVMRSPSWQRGCRTSWSCRRSPLEERWSASNESAPCCINCRCCHARRVGILHRVEARMHSDDSPAHFRRRRRVRREELAQRRVLWRALIGQPRLVSSCFLVKRTLVGVIAQRGAWRQLC